MFLFDFFFCATVKFQTQSRCTQLVSFYALLQHKSDICTPPIPKKAIIENQYHNNGEQCCVFSVIANYEQFTKVVNSWQNK